MSNGSEPAKPVVDTGHVTQVQLGEALLNPQWAGHLICLSDNGGDMVFIRITHPRHGMIDIVWPRQAAAGLRDWLNVALQAPVLMPVQPTQAQPAIEAPAAGTA